jgi:hypothetical protein
VPSQRRAGCARAAAGRADVLRESGMINKGKLADVLAELAERDPDVLLAVEEVDRSLIWLTLAMPPLERVRSAAASAATLARFHRVER